MCGHHNSYGINDHIAGTTRSINSIRVSHKNSKIDKEFGRQLLEMRFDLNSDAGREARTVEKIKTNARLQYECGIRPSIVACNKDNANDATVYYSISAVPKEARARVQKMVLSSSKSVSVRLHEWRHQTSTNILLVPADHCSFAPDYYGGDSHDMVGLEEGLNWLGDTEIGDTNESESPTAALPEPGMAMPPLPVPGTAVAPGGGSGETIAANNEGDCYINKRIAKVFNGKIYRGTVTKCTAGVEGDGGLWRVVYEDGDDEDLDLEELRAARTLFESEETNSAAAGGTTLGTEGDVVAGNSNMPVPASMRDAMPAVGSSPCVWSPLQLGSGSGPSEANDVAMPPLRIRDVMLEQPTLEQIMTAAYVQYYRSNGATTNHIVETIEAELYVRIEGPIKKMVEDRLAALRPGRPVLEEETGNIIWAPGTAAKEVAAAKATATAEENETRTGAKMEDGSIAGGIDTTAAPKTATATATASLQASVSTRDYQNDIQDGSHGTVFAGNKDIVQEQQICDPHFPYDFENNTGLPAHNEREESQSEAHADPLHADPLKRRVSTNRRQTMFVPDGGPLLPAPSPQLPAPSPQPPAPSPQLPAPRTKRKRGGTKSNPLSDKSNTASLASWPGQKLKKRGKKGQH